METIQTSKRVTVSGHEENSKNPDDGLRVDGTRHCDGLHKRLSPDKSVEISKNSSRGLKQPLADVVSVAGRYYSWVEIPPRVAYCACRPEKRKFLLEAPHSIFY